MQRGANRLAERAGRDPSQGMSSTARSVVRKRYLLSLRLLDDLAFLRRMRELEALFSVTTVFSKSAAR
jgi:hypothetical protein